MKKQQNQQWKKLMKRGTACFLAFMMVVSVFSSNIVSGYAEEEIPAGSGG